MIACTFLLSWLVTTAVPAAESRPGPARLKASDIRPERELLITDRAVLESPAAIYPGAWSFGGLVEELFGKEGAPEAVRRWLEGYYWDALPGTETSRLALHDPAIQWLSLQYPAAMAGAVPRRKEGQRVPGRAGIYQKVILPWQMRDGNNQASGQPWKPNLAHAPFRLLAIVNRIDLGAPSLADFDDPAEKRRKERGRSRGGYGGRALGEPTTDLGEGRLIFGAVGPGGQPLDGAWTLIFEYKLPVGGGTGPFPKSPKENLAHAAARRWAQAWHGLGGLELGSAAYQQALEGITRQFTHGKLGENGARERGASFAQLRSSEAAFGSGREFRQFGRGNITFSAEALPMTPAPEYLRENPEGSRRLAAFLRSIEPQIRDGTHVVPAQLAGPGFGRQLLAFNATIPAGDLDFHWETTPRVSRDARRLFSLNTCNGCHAAETGCLDGLHVFPRAAGESARLSNFLRMDGKANRVQEPGKKTWWVEQREMEDRAAILAALLEPRENRRLDALADTLKERLRRGH